ncbi:EAL domain-containing protein [Halomonas qinghailakensis]|uniref:EAL domain-containing protein n=1 Tax=Halomonas qinghailakensis TaxID=2937790 RepID=A0AA46TPB2_9GAMM|nr:EAL domain-containing protein [Halomonas sp. ZZQ-149]UYO73999.1 EAL domain-containing protein [Halomonas sp. ZZQ-149]
MTLKKPQDNSMVVERLNWQVKNNLLKSSVSRAELTLNSISDAIICSDLQGNVDYMNLAAEQMTGWKLEQAQGRSIDQIMPLIHDNSSAACQNPVSLVLKHSVPVSMVPGTMLVRRNGSTVAIEDSAAPIREPNGKISGAVIVFHDVTAALSLAINMSYLAHHDALTQLPNRVLLNDRIEHAISLAERRGSSLAVLFLDLDKFKNINDSLGHTVGDSLLQSVAQRLSACVRHSDTVSRSGGDEFVLLLTECRSTQDAALTAHKLLVSVADSYQIGQHNLQITSSIGISVYPDDALTAQALIKNADTAMYRAKHAGRNNFQFFRQDMNIWALERESIENSLKQALERQEFEVYYQPLINLQTGTITGAEALLRWQHPEWGLTLPERFITVAEESNLILPIGRWILREACLQARNWQDEGLAMSSMAVNISAREFYHADFVSGVRTILYETNLAPGWLQLDITERVLIQDTTTSTDILNQLKVLGVQLAVDNFGTGSSSLSELLMYPIDVLKIDGSFVHTIRERNGNSKVASAVIAMAESFGYKVIAEGVETPAQLEFLRHQHCNEGQGYLFSGSVAGAEFTKLMRTGLAT